MLILVDGQDGVGKSSLIRRLRERDSTRRASDDRLSSWRVLKANRPTGPNLLAEYLQPLLTYEPLGSRNTACDRWFLGELVYPQLTGRANLSDPLQLRYLVDWLRARGALLVHLTAPPSTIRERIAARDPSDPDADPQLIEQQAKLFAAAVAEVRHLGLGVLTLDTHHGLVDSPGSLDSAVLRQASRLEYQAARATGTDTYTGDSLRSLAHYVGSLRPRLLLIGDETGPAYPELRVPFAPLRRGCGAYLWQALSDSEPASHQTPTRYQALEGWLPPLSLSDLGVVNARDEHQRAPADLRRLWCQLGRPPVATLGVNAFTAAHGAGLPPARVTTLPHPQWVRRFHHSKLVNYGAAVWRAALHPGEDRRQTWHTSTS